MKILKYFTYALSTIVISAYTSYFVSNDETKSQKLQIEELQTQINVLENKLNAFQVITVITDTLKFKLVE